MAQTRKPSRRRWFRAIYQNSARRSASRIFQRVCHSLGLNPLTQPFEYITLNGKLRLYAKRDAADQLRKINGISIEIVSQEVSDGCLTVHVRAIDRNSRRDEDLGVVPFSDALKGEARANQILKAVTKAKRRVTLSISGLGFLDETEVATIPDAKPVLSRPQKRAITGEVISNEQIETLKTALKVREMPEERLLKWIRTGDYKEVKKITDIPVSIFQDCLDNVRQAGDPQ